MKFNAITAKIEKKALEKANDPWKKYKYSPEEIERKLNQAAQKAVREKFGNTILFTATDVFNIAIAMKRTDMDYMRIYLPKLRIAFKEAKKNNFYAMKLEKFDQKLFMDMLINGSDIRSMYETLFYLMKWFGLHRMTNLKFNAWIPADNRPGIYDKDEYDGSQWYEFVDNTMPNPDESEERIIEAIYQQDMEYCHD